MLSPPPQFTHSNRHKHNYATLQWTAEIVKGQKAKLLGNASNNQSKENKKSFIEAIVQSVNYHMLWA